MARTYRKIQDDWADDIRRSVRRRSARRLMRLLDEQQTLSGLTIGH